MSAGAYIRTTIPGYGCFDIPLATSNTAGGTISLLQQYLPERPWHGNKMLSCGLCQLQPEDIIDSRCSALVFTNYSEISNQEMG